MTTTRAPAWTSEAEAPELLEVQDAASLVVLDEHPSEEQRAEARAACEACPTEALSLIED